MGFICHDIQSLVDEGRDGHRGVRVLVREDCSRIMETGSCFHISIARYTHGCETVQASMVQP